MRYRRLKEPGATYFFTLVVHQRAPLFADASHVARWRGDVSKVQATRPFSMDAEVILPDHLHVLWTLPEADSDFPTRIRLAKSFFTKSPNLNTPQSANDSRRRKGERDVWQRRYWEHLIADERDFQMHLDYIHYNPVHHRLVARAADWPHSTFQDWVAKGVYDPWWGSDDMPPLPGLAGEVQ